MVLCALFSGCASSTADSESNNLSPIIKKQIDLAEALERQGKYAAATRILHGAIALECRNSALAKVQGPASEALERLFKKEREDSRAGVSLPTGALTSNNEEQERRTNKLTEIQRAITKYAELREHAADYMHKQQFPQAEAVLTKARDVCKDKLGQNSVELAETLHALADCARAQNQFKKSASLRYDELAIYESTNRKREQLLSVISDLAEELDRLGRFDESQRLHARALGLLQKQTPGDAILVLGRYTRSLFMQRKLEQANAMEAELRKRIKAGEASAFSMPFLLEFAVRNQEFENYSNALACYELAAELCNRSKKPLPASFYIALASCKFKLKDAQGAELSARHALEAKDLKKNEFAKLAGVLNTIAMGLPAKRRCELNRISLKLCDSSPGGPYSVAAISTMVQLSDGLLLAGDRKSSSKALQEAGQRVHKASQTPSITALRSAIDLRKKDSSRYGP